MQWCRGRAVRREEELPSEFWVGGELLVGKFAFQGAKSGAEEHFGDI